MAIPNNITNEHVLRAINEINNLSAIPNRRNFRIWALQYNNKLYPCKLIISYSNFFANGFELNPNPSIFTTVSARKYLEKLGYKIVQV